MGVIAQGFDRRVDHDLRRFFYLPYTHAEDASVQRTGLLLHEQLGDPEA